MLKVYKRHADGTEYTRPICPDHKKYSKMVEVKCEWPEGCDNIRRLRSRSFVKSAVYCEQHQRIAHNWSCYKSYRIQQKMPHIGLVEYARRIPQTRAEKLAAARRDKYELEQIDWQQLIPFDLPQISTPHLDRLVDGS